MPGSVDRAANTTSSVHALSSLARVADGHLVGPDSWVRDVCDDSRLVEPGWLFAAVEGNRTDGHRFARQAAAAGASALLVNRVLDVPVPQIVVPFVRAALGPVAAAIHGWPSEDLRVVGVTGTNGKTTTTMLLSAILETAGWQQGLIGTVETRVGRYHAASLMTTPPAPELQRTLHYMRREGASAVTMEVSSHAMDQLRVGGVRFELGIFLNLAAEHLDYHGTVEQYWSSKAALFAHDRCRQGIICIDEPWGRRLASQAVIPVTTFGRNDDASIVYRLEKSDLSGTRVRLVWSGEKVDLDGPGLIGPWNAPNMVAAYAAARSLGVSPTQAKKGLHEFQGAPGRCERIEAGQGFLVLVDYAHTPEAVAALGRFGHRLVAPGGRVWMVVGATGERDRLKRPGLGEAAAQSHVAVLTTDSPGHEDPNTILEQVRIGTLASRSQVIIEPDRARAIELAISRAEPGDVVFLAGRGHETTQLIGDERVPIDDRVVARQALADRGFFSLDEEVALIARQSG